MAPAYGYALRLTRNAADAEDLVQDATLHALRGFGTFMPGSNFKAWFFRVLTNCHRMTWRARMRRLWTVSAGDAPELYLYAQYGATGLPVEGDDPAGEVIGRLTQEAVLEAIRRLPADYREAAALYFTEDFSYEEIAEVLNIPVGTVRSRLHRARRLLQRALWRVAREHGVVGAPPQPQGPVRGLDRAGCEVAFRRINDYLDRELTSVEMALVREHLEVCALCSREFAFETSVINDVRTKLARLDLPADLRDRLGKRLAAPVRA